MVLKEMTEYITVSVSYKISLTIWAFQDTNTEHKL